MFGAIVPLQYSIAPVAYAEPGLSIPKPNTLPGQSVEDQQADKDKGGKYAVEALIPKVTKMLIGFAGITAFLFTVVGGIRFMVAYGETEAVTSAKKQITWSLVGLVIAIFAYTIISIISSIDFSK
ncbi:MAG: hypothetical protein US89_C0013G0044 [Candidatus Peregrinibacteria bacterium GW2011_GWF2_38_29]|nr:MAG: hypothetical protein US89_C0013G0044 [Candidatus Peregrinibacteria bacterium GW2011_GWF2_38_29]HBB02423.1 hypothetical protein [Candidatus Peregrinibacteria bacterium]